MADINERKARLAAVKNKSLKLMQMDANGTLDKMVEGKMGDINDSLLTSDANVTTESLMSSKRDKRTQPIPTAHMGVAAANVPSVIRESFQSQPPMTESEAQSSVLDDVFGLMDVQPKQRQQITEQAAPQMQQSFTTGGIDYPMIRTIVEDIVRKYSQSLKKNLMTEGVGNGLEINTIALGKTFKFLDSKGNIYECTMKKVGNVNKKSV